MGKKIVTIGFTLAIAISTIIILWWYYGFFSNYNYFTAKRDIKYGNVQFITFGLLLPSSKDKEIDIVATKYGFKGSNIGCTVTTQEINAIEIYNNVVEQYLSIRNGKNWRINYQREIDSLYKIAFDQDK